MDYPLSRSLRVKDPVRDLFGKKGCRPSFIPDTPFRPENISQTVETSRTFGEKGREEPAQLSRFLVLRRPVMSAPNDREYKIKNSREMFLSRKS